MNAKQLIQLSSELMRDVLLLAHPADAVVSRFFRQHRELGPRERATLAETAYKVLRHKRRFEWLSKSGSGSRERRMAILGFQGDRLFLQSGLQEQEKRWLEVIEAVKDEDLLPEHRHNLPQWLVEPLQQQLGSGFEALAQSLLEPAPLDLRVNTWLAKRDDVQKALHKLGVAAQDTPFSPWGLRIQGKPSLQKMDVFTSGQVEVQDEGSQLLALLVGASRGEMVADFCAGAGGKTLALGASMRNTGRLYAFDVSAHRLDALKPRLARSQLSNVHPVAIAHEKDERIKRLAGKMDRVLVDVPCSGLGTLRRNPDLKWRQSASTIAELQLKQASILESAAKLLKPGGRLVYATCSLLREENEERAEAFTLAHPEFRVLPVLDLLQTAQVSHAKALVMDGLGVQGAFLRLWPHQHQTDGFFAAVWEKK
jgi:16S rRNA (cytosine967-C5)-methyltransferase